MYYPVHVYKCYQSYYIHVTLCNISVYGIKSLLNCIKSNTSLTWVTKYDSANLPSTSVLVSTASSIA